MSEDKLKPCPFCGGEAEFDRVGNSRQSEIVKCTDCHCKLESSDMDHYSGTSWNTRTPNNAKVLEMVDNLLNIANFFATGLTKSEQVEQLTKIKNELKGGECE